MSIIKKLSAIQTELVAPKNQYNSFGKYKYRSTEDIFEGLKPLIQKYSVAITVQDDIILIGDRYYVKATAKITDTETGDFVENVAYAREEQDKKGMDSSQVTGATSSYARKYALNGLFAIDDTKDADTDELKNKQDNTPQSNPAPSQTKPQSKTTATPKSEPKKESTADDGVKKFIAEIDSLIRDKVKVDSAKSKDAVESVLGHGNYKKLDTIENGQKILDNLNKIQ